MISVTARPASEDLSRVLQQTSSFAPVFPPAVLERPVWLDLSEENPALKQLEILKTEVLGGFIDGEIARAGGTVGAGGYLERRNRYQDSPLFRSAGEPRSIHLAIDLWAPAGTPVHIPLPGKLHSFKDNANYFDYGPTVILTHELNGIAFHTLYGHLSRESLVALSSGKEFKGGEQLGTLGDATVNGDWPPHLHFQIIIDMEGIVGDYPGVAASSKVEHYRANCPDPNLILRLAR